MAWAGLVRLGGICALVLAPLTYAQIVTVPAPDRPCGLSALSALKGTSLALGSCERINSLDLDVIQLVMQYDTCHVANRERWSVTGQSLPQDRLNFVLKLTFSGSLMSEFTPEPRSPFAVKTGSVSIPLACAGPSRFYFSHPALGYLVAFRQTWPSSKFARSAPAKGAEELWRHDLPNFVRFEKDTSSTPDSGVPVVSPMEVIQAFDDYASVVTQIVPSGSYVLVESANTKAGFTQTVFHRSGALIATIGPWQGMVVGPATNGWQVAIDGGTNIATFAPTALVTVLMDDTKLERLIDHAIAWLTPRPTNRDAALTECLSRPPTELQYWLGSRFDRGLADQARSIVASLGETWRTTLESEPAVATLLRRFNPSSRAWQQEYRDALVAAGVDVDVFKAARPSVGAALKTDPSTTEQENQKNKP